MKVVIFGAAKDGLNCYFDLEKDHFIVAFADNNVDKQGKDIFGIKIIKPEELSGLEFDKVYVASKIRHKEIVKQLKALGVSEEKIKVYEENEMLREKTLNYLVDANCTYNYEQFEDKWKILKEKYNSINLYTLEVSAMGEMIHRFIWIVNDMEEKGKLNVFIPISGRETRLSNRELLRLFHKNIYIAESEEVLFWLYILQKHEKEINYSNIDKYMCRGNAPRYLIEREIIEFDKNDLIREKQQLDKMNIENPFVCFSARSANYNLKTIGNDFSYDYRNMNFLDYQKSINYLKDLGIDSIRMGREEEPLEYLNNCIDYAGYYANDFADLALIRNCMFLVSSATGIMMTAFLFNKPLLMINHAPVSFGYGSGGYTKHDLYIPQKYYDTQKERYLSLKEIIEIEKECLIFGDRFQKRGIVFIKNSPEEICKAVKEMKNKLEGTWIDTEEDKEALEKYSEIYREMEIAAKMNDKNWIGGPHPAKIATSYLRQNMYLLN